MSQLQVKQLNVSADGKQLLKNISLSVTQGEIVALFGPNGAGKSTLVQSIMGNEAFSCSGSVMLDGEDITKLRTEERAKRGMFVSFQHPVEIPGVSMLNFLRQSYNQIHGTKLRTHEFASVLDEKMAFLGMDKSFRMRFLNTGFSGGEKKLSEALQMLLFEPKIALLDEIDSGLDVDALKRISELIRHLQKEHKTGFLLISHYAELLKLVKPSKVYVLKNGEIVQEGNASLIEEIAKKGFKG